MSQNNVIQLNSNLITIENTTIHIHDLHFENDELAEFLRSHEDKKAALIELLKAAMLVHRLSSVSAETEALGAVAEKVRLSVEKAGDNAVEDITALLKSHTDIKNPGGLAIILKDQVSKMLSAELSPTNQNSPLQPLLRTVNEVLERVSEKVGIDKAEEKSNKKGADFNKTMHGIVAGIGSASDHEVEYTNDVLSSRGSKVGDSVVTLPSHVTGLDPLKIVWEYKAERKLTLNGILKELDEALRNRDAGAGVFVLAKEQEYESWPIEQVFSGNRMVIIVDKNDPDIYLVRYAALWAKIMVVKDLTTSTNSADVGKIAHLLDQAEITLKDFRNVTSAHNKIATGLSDAQRWAKEIENKLKLQLNQVSEIATGADEFEAIVAPLKAKKR
jgi:hypothetical protein